MSEQFEWAEDAMLRLKKIPFFVRGFAKKRIEKAAFERGLKTIDSQLMDEIKRKEMPR